MNVNALRESRSAKVAEMRNLVQAAETASRDLADNERARFDTLKTETAGLDERIGRAEHLDEMERRAEATPVTPHGSMVDLESRFRIGKALAEFADTGRLTGAEAEYAREHRSGRKEAFSAPVSLFLGGPREDRASPILTTSPTAGPGGNLISTQLGPLIQPLRPALKVQALGATVLPGLTENLALPRLTEGGAAQWVPEHGPVPQIDADFDRVNMSPQTIGCYYELSRRMLIQAPALEGILRADLGYKLAQGLDGSAIAGGAPSGGPPGIMATPGVPRLSYGATPSTPGAWLTLTGDMTGAIAEANVTGATGFLTNTFVKSAVNKLVNQIGEPLGIPTVFHNERVEFSNQVPSNGGASTNLSSIVYGNWADLVLGYWSSVDIVLNPYADSIATKGGALLLGFLDADIALRHPQSFVYATDCPSS